MLFKTKCYHILLKTTVFSITFVFWEIKNGKGSICSEGVGENEVRKTEIAEKDT